MPEARRPGAAREHAVTARLTRGTGGAARLRELLASGQTIVAPGAFDPLAARLVEEAGFPPWNRPGLGTSPHRLGRRNLAFLPMSERPATPGRIAPSVDIPVIPDPDTAYANPL